MSDKKIINNLDSDIKNLSKEQLEKLREGLVKKYGEENDVKKSAPSRK